MKVRDLVVVALARMVGKSASVPTTRFCDCTPT